MPGYLTAAVIVTYGERANLAIKSVTSARASGADFVTVVVNGGSEGNLRELHAGIESVPGVTIAMGHNTGSAGGYRCGMADVVAHQQADLLWLLDDDNVADPATLTLLQSALGDAEAVMPMRQESVFYRAINGTDPPPAGSFMYFDLWQRVREPFTRPGRPLSHLPYAPYGGLLIRRSAVERIGLPDTSYVLYEDDTEYTSRLTHHSSTAIRFVPDASVIDIDSKWHQGSRRTSMVFSSNAARQYFAVRNRTRFDYARASVAHRRVRFFGNFCAYFCAALVRDLPEVRPSRALRFFRAFTAGLRANGGVPAWLASIDDSLQLRECGSGTSKVRKYRQG